MDPIELLKNDHESVRGLLTRANETSDAEPGVRRELFEHLKREMEVHEAIEEEIFYPALKEHAEARDIVLEGYEEHHLVDRVMGELAATDVSDETWSAKFKVMKENIEHHIEEEEGEMFSKARELLADSGLQTLGERMAARKRELETSS